MDARLVDPLADNSWDSLIASHPASTTFHTSAWAKVLIDTYGHRPFYLQVSDGNNASAVVPLMEITSWATGRRAVSLPFSDFTEPLFFGPPGAEEVLEKLLQLARERKWKYFELRGGSVAPLSARPVTAFYGHRLDLTPGPSSLWRSIGSSVRRAIRKAEASGLSAEVNRTWEALLQFYQLHIRTRRKHGLPPQSKRFFFNIYKHIIAPGHGFVVLARKASQPLAGAVFFNACQNAIYKFGASNERMQEFRPNNLVMWEGIKYLSTNGVPSLNLGRTSLLNEGLRRFKSGWGAQEERIEYFRFDALRLEWISEKLNVPGFAVSVIKRLPLFVNRLIGTVFYPHLD